MSGTVDGWYAASGTRATFAFQVAQGRVVKTAPYGKFLRGLSWAEAWERLARGGFTVSRVP